MSVTVEPGRETVRVTWSNGDSHEFDYLWLRDNCACPECRDPDAWERLFDTVELPQDIRPRRVVADAGVRVEWPDGHVTSLSTEWLYEHRNGRATRDARARHEVLWDALIAEAPPSISFAEIECGDAGLIRWMSLIRSYGFALVHDVPTRVDAVLSLAERIAFVQESNFGRTFHVISKPDPENLAFTAHRLRAHTDLVNRHSAVNLQFLHCLQFDAEGGESVLVDGFEAARRLAEADPEAHELLRTVPVPWRFQNDEVDIANHWPVITTGPDGRYLEIRLNTALMAPLDIDTEMVRPFYRALSAFGRILRDPRMEYAFKMRPGDCQVFDNQRVLHARAAYDPSSGARHLQGCYVDKDDFLGRLAAMQRGRDFRRS
jgi:gamma-butyrobetaine dioxygenase